ncbi:MULTISPECIES: zinc-binding dehydrogenase [unclassified Streptomyces]|uniref:zinc-binding dehydrogenase n=1 Tax=unclassified Streptomyces TaxID=2593676 RepID=UPI000BAC61FC|nr:zinc-binding dehydrogenase [Streptomyces sp. CLI2509]ASY31602.1 alcohol dehydrogenase [Streptomyces sp. CLI2509]MYX21438.1 alcohol dehydrogenase catalytic domain-containing protein [Streptomyces sp. SID8380]
MNDVNDLNSQHGDRARYARWEGVGRPFALVTTGLPRPAPGETLVRIDLATVCGSDLHTVRGRRPSPVPAVLGHEQVGTVVAVGAGGASCVDGTPVEPGMRVVWSVSASCGDCDRCARAMPQKCRRLRKYGHEALDEAAPLTGGFATHCVVLPGTAVVAVPDGLPDRVVCPASCATATVAAVLAEAGPLEGRQVLVTGAGMLGVTAAAMAASAGAHVVVMDPHPLRRERALRFGAVKVCDTHGVPEDMDVAVELSGRAEAVEACLRSLAVGGTVVLAGSVSPGDPVALDPEWVVRGLHRLVGVHNYRPADLQRAVDFLAAHHRRLPFAELVEGAYPLEGLDEAVAAAHDAVAPRQAVVPSA